MIIEFPTNLKHIVCLQTADTLNLFVSYASCQRFSQSSTTTRKNENENLKKHKASVSAFILVMEHVSGKEDGDAGTAREDQDRRFLT